MEESNVKSIEVLIKLPGDWLDTKYLDNISWMTQSVRDEVRRQLVRAVTEQVQIPQILITPDELKERVLQIMAEEVAERTSKS